MRRSHETSLSQHLWVPCAMRGWSHVIPFRIIMYLAMFYEGLYVILENISKISIICSFCVMHVLLISLLICKITLQILISMDFAGYMQGLQLLVCRIWDGYSKLLPLPPPHLSQVLTLPVTLGWEKWFWVCDKIFLLALLCFDRGLGQIQGLDGA